MSLNIFSPKNKKWTPICQHKMTHLAYQCVTMNEFMDKFYEKTELSDVKFKNGSKLNGKLSNYKFEKHQLLLNPPMKIRILLQISEYNGLIDEYRKKT